MATPDTLAEAVRAALDLAHQAEGLAPHSAEARAARLAGRRAEAAGHQPDAPGALDTARRAVQAARIAVDALHRRRPSAPTPTPIRNRDDLPSARMIRLRRGALAGATGSLVEAWAALRFAR